MIGTVLGSRYRILEELGRGGMGEVYLAEHIHLGRREAVKVLQPNIAASPQFVSRFRREARAVNRLQHPNVVGVYNFGQLPDGRLYLAMEYAEGTPLDRVLREQGALPVSRVLRIVAQMSQAVEHAHSRGVIHRDLKPSNMILGESRGQPDFLKILDFGVAKITAPDYNEAAPLTNDGDVLGTPAYMAPELIFGDPPDARIDIYAIGCIAYELLVGEPPFIGGPAELMHAHVGQEVVRPSERRPGAQIPELFDTVITTCLAKLPDDRFQSAANLYNLLTQVPGFTSSKPGSGRRSRLNVPGSHDFVEDTHASTTPGEELIGVVDTAHMTRAEIHNGLRESMLELAEWILDQTGDSQLSVAVAEIKTQEDEVARVDSQQELLALRENNAVQTAREREASLRFTIGELEFDRARARPDEKASLDQQVVIMESRLAALVEDAARKLDVIVEEGIALAAERDELEARCVAAYEQLAEYLDPLIDRFDADLDVAPLIDRYQSIRELLAQMAARSADAAMEAAPTMAFRRDSPGFDGDATKPE